VNPADFVFSAVFAILVKMMALSRLIQARGLKLSRNLSEVLKMAVAPYTGAWIETNKQTGLKNG